MMPDTRFWNKAEFRFKDVAILRNDLVLFHKSDIIKIIQYCKEENIRILGFDGFYIYDDGKIQPSMEHSIDLSNYDETANKDCYVESVEYIQKQNDSMLFEIVC